MRLQSILAPNNLERLSFVYAKAVKLFKEWAIQSYEDVMAISIIYECGGKMLMRQELFGEAYDSFRSAFIHHDNNGNDRRVFCLKNMILSNCFLEDWHWLTVDQDLNRRVQPFYEVPELVAMFEFMTAFRSKDIVGMYGLIEDHFRVLRNEDDRFLKTHMQILMDMVKVEFNGIPLPRNFPGVILLEMFNFSNDNDVNMFVCKRWGQVICSNVRKLSVPPIRHECGEHPREPSAFQAERSWPREMIGFACRALRMDQLRAHAEEELSRRANNASTSLPSKASSTVDFYIINYIKELTMLVNRTTDKLRSKPLKIAALQEFSDQLEWTIHEADGFIQKGNFEKLVESPNLVQLYKTIAAAKKIRENVHERVRMLRWKEEYQDFDMRVLIDLLRANDVPLLYDEVYYRYRDVTGLVLTQDKLNDILQVDAVNPSEAFEIYAIRQQEYLELEPEVLILPSHIYGNILRLEIVKIDNPAEKQASTSKPKFKKMFLKKAPSDSKLNFSDWKRAKLSRPRSEDDLLMPNSKEESKILIQLLDVRRRRENCFFTNLCGLQDEEMTPRLLYLFEERERMMEMMAGNRPGGSRHDPNWYRTRLRDIERRMMMLQRIRNRDVRVRRRRPRSMEIRHQRQDPDLYRHHPRRQSSDDETDVEMIDHYMQGL